MSQYISSSSNFCRRAISFVTSQFSVHKSVCSASQSIETVKTKTYSQTILNHTKLTSSQQEKLPVTAKSYRDRFNSDRSTFIIPTAIGMVLATLILADEDSSDPTWDEELEPIAQVFGLDLSPYTSKYKEALQLCFNKVFQACLDGDWALIGQLDAPTLSKLRDNWGQSLLIAAVSEGNEKVVKALVDRKIALDKTDPEGNTPLHIAAKNGFDYLFPTIRNYYINDTNKKGETSLHLAIMHGHRSALEALVEKGAKSTSLKREGNDFTPLALCVRFNQKECLDYLLTHPKHPIDESSNMGTLLHVAVRFEQYSMLKTLMGNEKSIPLLEKQDKEGRTPIALACFIGDLEMVDFLCDRMGAKLLQNQGHQGWTLAHWAAFGKRQEVLEFLAYKELDIDVKNQEGKTPKALLKADSSSDAKAVKNTIDSLIEQKKTGALQSVNFLRQPPTGIVLKGGGPRGLAYIEALRALQEEGLLNDVKRVAGTSAGSITAAIYALDPGLKEIDSLKDLNLMMFLDAVPGQEALLKGILKAKGPENKSLFAKISSIPLTVWNPLNLYNVFAQLDGICEGEAIRQWIENEIYKSTGIHNCTFGELKKEIEKGKKFLHLHVYATRPLADPKDRILHFSSEDKQWENIVISDAVRASMSIPGVFKPYTVCEKTRSNTLIPRTDLGPCVDGGLVSNFPLNAFDPNQPGQYYSAYNKRTLGLFLKDEEVQPTPTATQPAGLLDVAKICASVFWQQQDTDLGEDKKNQDRIIEIPIRGVGLLDFNLTAQQKEELSTTGRQSIKKAFPTKAAAERKFVHLKASNAPRKLTHFTGREDLLEKLGKDFSQPNPSTDETVVRLIHGLGGMGKSELARTFVRDHQDDFSITWFINSATPEQKNQSYKELAEKLGLICQEKEPPEQIRRKVHNKLKNHDYDKPWLLVYDNIEKEIDEEKDIPKGGYVIMTSRYRNVWPDEKDRIELSEFTPKESEQILFKITRKTSPLTKALAEQLGHFPLALYQAGKYIHEADCTIDNYLKDLRKNPLKAGVALEERYQQTLTNVWNITLVKLKNDHPEAYHWLNICAHLNPDDIPLNWLPDKRSEMDIRRALSNFSLIRVHDKGYSIHRLLHLVIRESQNSQKAELFKEAFYFLQKKGEELHKNQNDWPTLAKELGTSWPMQFSYILNNLNSMNNIVSSELIQPLEALCHYSYYALSDYHLIVNFATLGITASLSANNPDREAAFYRWRGTALFKLQKLDDAENDYNQDRIITEKIYPDNKLKINDVTHNFAGIVLVNGKNQKSLKKIKEAKSILINCLKIYMETEARDTVIATCQGNLGLAFLLEGGLESNRVESQKCYDMAVNYLSDAITTSSKVFPQGGNPTTAQFHYWKGKAYFRLKEYKQAKIEFEQALNEAINSPKKASYLFLLGKTQKALGMPREALTSFEKARIIKLNLYKDKDDPKVQKIIREMDNAFPKGWIEWIRDLF